MSPDFRLIAIVKTEGGGKRKDMATLRWKDYTYTGNNCTEYHAVEVWRVSM